MGAVDDPIDRNDGKVGGSSGTIEDGRICDIEEIDISVVTAGGDVPGASGTAPGVIAAAEEGVWLV